MTFIIRRKVLVLFRCLLGIFLCGPVHSYCQTASSSSPSSASDRGVPFTLHVQAREVIIDVVARLQHGHPVSDLQQSDFQIFEVTRSAKLLRSVSSFRVIDPALETNGLEAVASGSRVVIGHGCALATTFHYELAFHPSSDGWTGGYHEVLIETKRLHVTLSFPRRYYVGETSTTTKHVQSVADANVELKQAACFHAAVPPSILLDAHLIHTNDTEPLRYSLVVGADSLAFASITDDARRVKLDYGACVFSAAGKPLEFVHASNELVLSQQEYERAQSMGFSTLFNVPRSENASLVRFVIRDRETGNIGSVDVSTALAGPLALTKTRQEAKGVRANSQTFVGPPFGSIIPQPGAMCGDVYELPEQTTKLPKDFWSMDAIGALYTYFLNEPFQYLSTGLAGITPRPEWFVIDYHGVFWVDKPGEYKFRLTSDDGAKLFMDDHLLINVDGIHWVETKEGTEKLAVGRHTFRVSYFQGPWKLQLVLEVKPPAGAFRIFDVREFARTSFDENEKTMKR